MNERQIEALRLLVNEKRVLTNALYQELFAVSRRTALRDINNLVKAGQKNIYFFNLFSLSSLSSFVSLCLNIIFDPISCQMIIDDLTIIFVC